MRPVAARFRGSFAAGCKPENQCRPGCFDLQTDAAHCGSCDKACEPGAACVLSRSSTLSKTTVAAADGWYMVVIDSGSSEAGLYSSSRGAGSLAGRPRPCQRAVQTPP